MFEQLGEMIIDRSDGGMPDGRGTLKLGTVIDESGDRAREGRFIAGAVSGAGVRGEEIERSAAVGHDHRQAACARFGRNQAKGLGFAAVNQRIGTGQQPRNLLPIVEPRENSHVAAARRHDLKPGASWSVADQQQAEAVIARAGLHGANDHLPPLFAREAADPDEQGRLGRQAKRLQGRGAQADRPQLG